MNQQKRRIQTWKWLLPVTVFVLGCVCLAYFLYNVYTSNREQLQTVTELNAMTYAERMTTDLNKGISITESLQEILVSEHGEINNFSHVAEDLMTDEIQSIQLAPDGVVTEIYPEAGNEAG